MPSHRAQPTESLTSSRISPRSIFFLVRLNLLIAFSLAPPFGLLLDFSPAPSPVIPENPPRWHSAFGAAPKPTRHSQLRPRSDPIDGTMSQAQNSAHHHRPFGGIPTGGCFHNSPTAVPPPLAHSPNVSAATPLGGAAYTPGGEARSLPRWQALGPHADLHSATKWPKNSSRPSTALDAFSAAYLEHFDAAIRGTDGHHKQQQQQQLVDGLGRLSSSVASALQRDALGSARSSPLLGALVPSTPRSSDAWKVGADQGSPGLPVDSPKGSVLDVHGVIGPPPPTSSHSSLLRFPANTGFAERAARFSALGTGPYSTSSFPLVENGNVGRLAGLAGDSNDRPRPLAAPTRGELMAEAGGPNWASHVHASGPEKRADEKTGIAGAKAFGSTLFVSPDCSQVDEEDGLGEQIADTDEDEAEEGASSESNTSDVCRGQQEMSSADHVTGNRLCRSPSMAGQKRKNSSAVASPPKAAFPVSRKERKSGHGQLKRCNDGEEAADKEEQKAKAELSGSENSGLSNSPAPKETAKTQEAPKQDYIHVRARRGQATDSHSLAERVRREKISERMKFLQDLVPGCSKVTGKAMQLDEIINYVQSIQRQVEFLSMKLATVTLRPDLHMDPVLRNQLQFATGYGQPGVADHASTSPSFAHMQSQPVLMQQALPSGVDFQSLFDISLERMNGNPAPAPKITWDAFDIGAPQASGIWDGDLRSVVEMGSGGESGLLERQRNLQLGQVKREL